MKRSYRNTEYGDCGIVVAAFSVSAAVLIGNLLWILDRMRMPGWFARFRREIAGEYSRAVIQRAREPADPRHRSNGGNRRPA